MQHSIVPVALRRVTKAVEVCGGHDTSWGHRDAGARQQAAAIAGRLGTWPIRVASWLQGYSLAAGLSLGLITLGRGRGATGLADLRVEDRLRCVGRDAFWRELVHGW